MEHPTLSQEVNGTFEYNESYSRDHRNYKVIDFMIRDCGKLMASKKDGSRWKNLYKLLRTDRLVVATVDDPTRGTIADFAFVRDKDIDLSWIFF